MRFYDNMCYKQTFLGVLYETCPARRFALKRFVPNVLR